MKTEPYTLTDFTPADLAATRPAMKVGILATINPLGRPHLTLTSTLMTCGPREIAWGAFTEGMSKQNVRTNPQVGFLIMTLDKYVWRGTAAFTRTARSGAEYDYYNATPMFRYNAYFGVHTVYYASLLSHTGRQALPINRVIFGAIQTMLLRALTAKKSTVEILNPWTRNFYRKIDNLKFLSYIRPDGYPVIIPTIQAQTLDASRLVFSAGAFGSELASIPDGSTVAVFGMALTMEDVLVSGTYHGLQHIAGMRCGVVDVEWVYNPMPPAPAQIYPPVDLAAVEEY